MLYKRSDRPGAHWWVRFAVRGIEVRQSSGTDRKELAETFEQQLREAIWNEQTLGIEEHTWGEACARWCKEKAHKRSLLRDRQAIAKLMVSGNLRGIRISEIDKSVGSRELAVLRSILNACVKWEWLDKAPKVEMPPVEKHDPRWITQEEFKTLCQELPPHAAQLARFAVATGLRQANIFKLEWRNVGMAAKLLSVGAHQSKSRKAIGVPLNDDACAVLKRQSGIHPIYVFGDHSGRAPIGSIKTTWLKAVKRAGIEGFRFHDLRHTWAAWHTLAGTPPLILKELGGWASLNMLEKYASLGVGHLADWANNSGARNGEKKARRMHKKNVK